MTNPAKSIQVSKTNCVVLCLGEFIHVSVLILCLNVQTLVDQFGCSVRARVGKVKKGVNVCFFLHVYWIQVLVLFYIGNLWSKIIQIKMHQSDHLIPSGPRLIVTFCAPLSDFMIFINSLVETKYLFFTSLPRSEDGQHVVFSHPLGWIEESSNVRFKARKRRWSGYISDIEDV